MTVPQMRELEELACPYLNPHNLILLMLGTDCLSASVRTRKAQLRVVGISFASWQGAEKL
ncbi:MAG TPA: hypothetical protein VFE27_13220, partial [Acidobacteriaceae bacterium]|jgi:hypothetical protein|nr:hypothetical protein [Acidobacteriaceae bacterium]